MMRSLYRLLTIGIIFYFQLQHKLNMRSTWGGLSWVKKDGEGRKEFDQKRSRKRLAVSVISWGETDYSKMSNWYNPRVKRYRSERNLDIRHCQNRGKSWAWKVSPHQTLKNAVINSSQNMVTLDRKGEKVEYEMFFVIDVYISFFATKTCLTICPDSWDWISLPNASYLGSGSDSENSF